MAASFARQLALVAFAAITLRGLVGGADFQGTLRAALYSLPVFFLVGLLCGEIARLVVEERVEEELRAAEANRSTSATLASPAEPADESRD